MPDIPSGEDAGGDERAAEQGGHGRREAQGPLRQLQEERRQVRQSSTCTVAACAAPPTVATGAAGTIAIFVAIAAAFLFTAIALTHAHGFPHPLRKISRHDLFRTGVNCDIRTGVNLDSLGTL